MSDERVADRARNRDISVQIELDSEASRFITDCGTRIVSESRNDFWRLDLWMREEYVDVLDAAKRAAQLNVALGGDDLTPEFAEKLGSEVSHALHHHDRSRALTLIDEFKRELRANSANREVIERLEGHLERAL